MHGIHGSREACLEAGHLRGPPGVAKTDHFRSATSIPVYVLYVFQTGSVCFSNWTHLVGGLRNAKEHLLEGRNDVGSHSHLRRKGKEHATRKPGDILHMPLQYYTHILYSAHSRTLHREAEAIQSILPPAPTSGFTPSSRAMYAAPRNMASIRTASALNSCIARTAVSSSSRAAVPEVHLHRLRTGLWAWLYSSNIQDPETTETAGGNNM